MFGLLLIFLTILLFTNVSSHSQLTWPQSTSPHTCRIGGEPRFGDVGTCGGPCDLRAIEGGYANFGSSDNPAATFKRGQPVRMKYQRNNHGPGGFIRLTLVSPDKMMNKAEHDKNAFYYSCWGGNAVKAEPDELERWPQDGFSMIGTDGEQHDLEPGYYTTDVTIPPVIPDGDYVLGWAWYGGTGGGDVENNGPATKEPTPWGYFSDYWACSFIRIEGGDDLVAEHTPVFDNDMSQFSSEGCMAANDALGICISEPCNGIEGKYQKPREFKNGKTPRPLIPEDFGGVSPDKPAETPMPIPEATPMAPQETPMPTEEGVPQPSPEDMSLVGKRSCRCIASGDRCWRKLASKTLDYCTPFTSPDDQPMLCKEWCCGFCENRRNSRLCMDDNVKDVCNL